MIDEILDKIKNIRKQYSDLINKRMEELDFSEEQKSLKTPDFMNEEMRLNEESVLLKLSIGINCTDGYAVLCNVCRGIFGNTNVSGNRSIFYRCEEHNGLDKVIFDEDMHANKPT